MAKMQIPTLTSAAAKLPISLDEFAAQVRIDAVDDEAALLGGYIAAATERLSGYEGELGKALITQTWRTDWDKFPAGRRLDLPLGPVQSVVVTYSDANNVEQTFAASKYAAHEDSHGPYLWLDEGQSSWPGTYDREDAARISTVVGYGDDPSDVPELIRLALMHTVAHWYSNREPILIGSIRAELPMVADALLTNYRKPAF